MPAGAGRATTQKGWIMAEITDANQAIRSLGLKRVVKALGVSEQMVRKAGREGQFPASWHRVLSELDAEREAPEGLSQDLFKYRAREDG